MARTLSTITAILSALLFFAFVIFSAIYILSSPLAVRAMIMATQGDSNLSRQQRLDAADLTTRFVRSGSREEAMTAFYREDIKSGALSIRHLEDVHAVFQHTWVLGAICALLVVSILIETYQKMWWEWLRLALRITAGLCLIVPIFVSLFILATFDSLFTSFHKLFFPQGNWQFASDSFLIQIFPEQFWMMCAILLITLIVLAGLLILFSDYLAHRQRVVLRELRHP
ncbi:MAG: TIGR01906 family membrane protein [Actinomycetia bacterium]|nr:TIGR01906 family membrane protein [Actinomycetes bacterium]